MGNITGNPFAPGVVKQINQRQTFMGANPKDDRHIIYQNNKGAFLRLASSIRIAGYDPANIDEPNQQTANNSANEILQLRGLSSLYKNDILAKSAVLFGGIVSVNDSLNPQLNYGLKEIFDPNDPFNGAYGWGGLSQGYRPMPGIISADVSFYNRGALAKATVKCKCYSIEQLQVFDLLYFRIGYTMLLEWGHNIYLDNNGQLQERKVFNTDAFDKFFEDKPNQDAILDAIKSERLKSSYNYDAMLGKITNFTWKFNVDGSYDVDLNLVGYGDIVESLKINTSRGGQPAQLAAQAESNIKNLRQSVTNLRKEIEKIPAALKPQFISITEDLTSLSEQLTKINQLAARWNQNYFIDSNSVIPAYISGPDAFGIVRLRVGQLTPEERNSQSLNQSSNSLNFLVRASSIDNDIFVGLQIKGGIVASPSSKGGFGVFGPNINSFPEIPPSLKALAGSNTPYEYWRQIIIKNQGYAQSIKALEKKKEGDQALPEIAKEYAETTEFHRQLYRWIEQYQSGNYDAEELYAINFQVQSSDSGGSQTTVTSRNQYYVRLGYLLEWIEDNLLVYDDSKEILKRRKTYPETIQVKTKNNQTENVPNYKKPVISDESFPVPLFRIDTESGPATIETEEDLYGNKTEVTKGNFCLKFDIQISADPSVCLIPMRKEFKTVSVGNQNTNQTQVKKGKTQPKIEQLVGWSFFQDNPLNQYNDPNNTEVGRIMNIFVNIDFLSNALQALVDKNGRVNLLKLMQNLCTSINDALGNVNKLEPIYDGETNTLKIIEGSKLQIKGKENDTKKIAVFEIYGVQVGTKGSFVTNVDFQVQLPPNMAAMATISAQSRGNIVGENATGLSKLNKGLLDRVVTRKLDASILGLPEKGAADDPEIILNQKLVAMTKYLNQLYKDKKFSKANVDALKSINRDIAAYYTGIAAEKEQAPAPFFIPFNLSLEMDGLSGMINYQRFAVNEAILPYSYRPAGTTQNGVIDFLIKGVSHTISSNKWKTKIESLTVSSKRKGTT